MRRVHSRHRRGTSAVETAVVLPVFLFIVFAIIEFGHAQMVNNMLDSACRNGSRLGSVEGTTTNDVSTKVVQTMGRVINTSSLEVMVKDASIYDSGIAPTDEEGMNALPNAEVSEIEPRQLFLVRAQLPYNDIALVPMPFMDGVVLESNSFMRHE